MRSTRPLLLVALFLFALDASAANSESSPQPPPTRPQPTPRPSQHPMRVGRMNGRYFCAQGWTNLQLHITAVRGAAVEAIFSFVHSPTAARGEYSMTGALDPRTGSLVLTPVAWINRPRGYVMVGMNGLVQSNGVYSGRIANPSCGEFTVTPSGI